MPSQTRPLARKRGALMLVAESFDHLATRVHELHRAIADIPFKLLQRVPLVKQGAAPTQQMHDGVTDGVYGIVRGTARVLFSAADSALRLVDSRVPAALPSPAPSTRTQDNLVSALSGFVGDHMAHRHNPLSIRFGVYQSGLRLRLDAGALRDAFPHATPRIAVFVHGLCGNEHTWSMFRDDNDAQTRPYGERLLEDLGYTPVYVRYNSGLRISRNGRACAAVLERLQAQWPVPLQEIVLIGHSMGGLVARSAADHGAAHGANWLAFLRQIVCLGTPHLGAPLEKAVHLGTHLMHRLPLTRPIARLLDARSHGIKDLRWGYTHDSEWRQRDPDAFWTQDRLQRAPVPSVRYRFLGTCLTRDPEHPLTRAIGDGLVRLPSSLAIDIAGADSALRVQLDHMRLLNHPEVYVQLRSWLAEA